MKKAFNIGDNDRRIIEDFQDTLTKMFLYSEHSNIMLRNKHVEITKVIFNNPATIVFWSDGKKTVVKCAGDEAFDEEKGLAMAISKRVLGNHGNYYNEFKKWLPKIDNCDDAVFLMHDNKVLGVLDGTFRKNFQEMSNNEVIISFIFNIYNWRVMAYCTAC